MLQKINNIVRDSSIKLGILSLYAVLINCIFIALYVYEYNLSSKELIYNIGLVIVIITIITVVLYFVGNSFKEKYFPIMCLISIFLGLSFLSTYAVFITDGKKYLVLNFSSSLLLLAMIFDWWIFIMMSIGGVVVAYLVFLLTNVDPNIQIIHASKKMYLLSYLLSYTLFAVSLFMRKKEQIQARKIDFIKVFGSAIAHEVNAPLASIQMISNVLDMIVQNMHTVVVEDGYKITLDKMDYEMLVNTINDGLKKASHDAIQIVEMLLSTVRDKYTNNKALCSVSEIAKEAIKMAEPLDPNGNKIFLNIQEDFEIVCSRQLMKHVIYNLIKNSLKHGGPNVNVAINIGNNQLIVHDNGVGIPNEKIKQIFGAFMTGGNGHGIGLAFCQFVLDEVSATIKCESELGKYSKFIINFLAAP